MALTATGNLFDIESTSFEEIINKDVEVLLPTLDPAWRDTFVSNQGVFPTSQLGRQWKAIRVIRGTYTGVIDGGVSRSDFTLYGETHTRWGDNILMQQIDQTFPDPLEGPKPGSLRLAVPVQSMNTNLALSWQELQAEASPAYIGQVVAPILTGFAKNIAHQLCNFWYTSQNSDYALATVGTVVDAGTAHPDYSGIIQFQFTTSEMTPNRFYRGQRVDIYTTAANEAVDTSSTSSAGQGGGKGAAFRRANDTNAAVANQTVSSRINVVVEYVDELANTVSLVSDTALANWLDGAFQLSAGDVIRPANIKTGAGSFTGIAGINSWLKGGSGGDDNFLLGAERDSTDFVDVTSHPEYKSLVASISGPLTEPLLLTILRRFHSSKDRYGMDCDCLIASDGVWLEYFRQMVPQFSRERSGRLASLNDEGLANGFNFTADGRSMMGYMSTYIEDGTVYGLKKGGQNWERIVPPFPNRAASMSGMDSFIPFRFVLPSILNTNQTRALVYQNPATANSASPRVTEFAQMPGTVHLNLVPKQPAGIKLTDVTSYTYWP